MLYKAHISIRHGSETIVIFLLSLLPDWTLTPQPSSAEIVDTDLPGMSRRTPTYVHMPLECPRHTNICTPPLEYTRHTNICTHAVRSLFLLQILVRLEVSHYSVIHSIKKKKAFPTPCCVFGIWC